MMSKVISDIFVNLTKSSKLFCTWHLCKVHLWKEDNEGPIISTNLNVCFETNVNMRSYFAVPWIDKITCHFLSFIIFMIH